PTALATSADAGKSHSIRFDPASKTDTKSGSITRCYLAPRYTSRFTCARLLLLEERHGVHRLTLGVLALRRSRPCFSIGGRDDGDDGRDFSILFAGEARGLCVDPREGHGVSVRIVSGYGIVLAVILAAELPMPRRIVSWNGVNSEFDAVADRFNFGGAAL